MNLKKLNTWLKKNNMDYKDLARILNVDKTTAFKYCNGTRSITLKKAVKIEEITRGEISCRDLV